MGSNQSVLKSKGYTLVSEQDGKMLVKNEDGDQFVIKMLKADQGAVSTFIQKLNHPHIVKHKDIFQDNDCLYLALEHCEGGDLSQLIELKINGPITFSQMMSKPQGHQTAGLNQPWITNDNKQILDWTVKVCMALKHLHDQQILHKNLQPKNICFTACGTIRFGEFGAINEWSADAKPAENKALSYVAPENLNGKPFDEKSEIWSLGCIIYEMCSLKCAFTGSSTVNIISKILTGSYEALPNTFSQDLRQLVADTLQNDPENRPSVSEILIRPFIIQHLYQMGKQTIEELNGSLKVLEDLANSLEKVHYNTTVGSLTGGVVGLAGGITSIVGLILTPFTLGASLIVTGVGIGVAVAGGVASGVSNVTKMVNQRSNRQNIKLTITELQEKITSTTCCIQNIQIAVETQKLLSERNNLWSNTQSGAVPLVSAGARLGRGLGGIAELVRLTQVASVGRTAAQAARVVRVAEAASGVLTGLFVAVDIFFIALDSKEIHRLRKDYASIRQNEQELQSEIMKFVKKIREAKDNLKKILGELKAELEKLKPEIPN